MVRPRTRVCIAFIDRYRLSMTQPTEVETMARVKTNQGGWLNLDHVAELAPIEQRRLTSRCATGREPLTGPSGASS
jgi:hypothetical protein